MLGNVVTDLANLLNGQPSNAKLNINSINNDLEHLLTELNNQIPGLSSSTTTTTPAPASGSENVLSLTVPPIDLNLLGLVLQTRLSRDFRQTDAQSG